MAFASLQNLLCAALILGYFRAVDAEPIIDLGYAQYQGAVDTNLNITSFLGIRIYSPNLNSSLPTIVWIHGGGYSLGAASFYNGSELVQEANNEVVVVVIQYRLGLFGFLAGQEVKDGGVPNAGLLDQDFALRWVNKNIHKFGGDPDRVAIWGQSAGAGSVIQHIVARNGKTSPKLFRAAMTSSTYLGYQYKYNSEIPQAVFNLVAAQAGCNGTSPLNCLRGLDSATLAEINVNLITDAFTGTFMFYPVVDGSFIIQSPTDALAQGKLNTDILLSVTNANEGALFINQTGDYDVAEYVHNLFPLLGSEDISAVASLYESIGSSTDQLNAILGESSFVCPTYLLLNAFSGKSYKGFLSFAVNLDPNVKVRPSIAPVWRKWFRDAETEMLFNKTELNTPDIAPVNTSEALLTRCELPHSRFHPPLVFKYVSGTISCLDPHSMVSADHLLALTVSCILLAVTAGILQRRKATSQLPFPPGLKPRFLVGNLFDVPAVSPWKTYTEWGKQYGDVMHVQMFGEHILILNSVKAATELLEKRAPLYSDRPTIPMLPLIGWGFNFSFMSRTNKWRERRRLFHQHFRPDAAAAYRPVQLSKIQDLLRGLLYTPEDFAVHIKTLAAAIILDMVYGYDVKSMQDRFVHLTEEAVQRLCDVVLPGSSIVNTFPFLRYLPSWFPGCSFHKFARETSELVDEMQNAPFDFVKQNLRNGCAKPSVMRELLEQNDTHGDCAEREQIMNDVAGVAYSAGVDTTTAILMVFWIAMTLNPEVAKKAQNELDAVVGPGFLPGFEHRSELPYCEAVFREVFRWGPILPLGIPHATSEDDIYEGYFIPKGTTVIPNIWAMAHDGSMYSSPDKFDPERFLDADGQLNTDDHILAFGFGRRICVGRYAADATVWATIVSVLSTFDIAKPKDATGKEIEIEPVYIDGLLRYPKPFECSITPRNELTRQLIATMMDV
ncbi:Cytochrome p450 [Mycena sanguinolenta]|uniref:Cytochrome p450 n=1 Tax=Mycena sanguinolenta TaxID=230812 RepID=A0A8H7CQH5_9AGAR|nr:Cytochrome p450 [Mycena sanguinolenta]